MHNLPPLSKHNTKMMDFADTLMNETSVQCNWVALIDNVSQLLQLAIHDLFYSLEYLVLGHNEKIFHICTKVLSLTDHSLVF